MPAAEAGFRYHVFIGRDKRIGKARRVEVYTFPTKDHTTGINDGYWRIAWHEDFSSQEKGERKRMMISDSDVHGEVYLGKEGSDVIQSIAITDQRTSLALKTVSFGGFPHVHIDVRAWGVDPKDNSRIGPIGPVRELWILGMARAARPVGEHIMDSDSATIPITGEIPPTGVKFQFDRGDIGFGVKVREDQAGREWLDFAFVGQGERKEGIIIGGQPVVSKLGPQQKTLSVPRDFLDGNKVLDILERCVNNLEVSFNRGDSNLLGPKKVRP